MIAPAVPSAIDQFLGGIAGFTHAHHAHPEFRIIGNRDIAVVACCVGAVQISQPLTPTFWSHVLTAAEVPCHG
jgi:hypothetical protein